MVPVSNPAKEMRKPARQLGIQRNITYPADNIHESKLFGTTLRNSDMIQKICTALAILALSVLCAVSIQILCFHGLALFSKGWADITPFNAPLAVRTPKAHIHSQR